MNQRIIIKVASDGATEVRTEGFTGAGCRQASELIERALGTRQSEQLTADYFKTDTKVDNQSLQQGDHS